MDDKNIHDVVSEIKDTLSEDFVKNLSDEQLNEITTLINEIKEKLQD